MFQATSQQIENMQRAIAEIRTGGDAAFAQAWLVWAEVHLNTLDVPGPHTASTEKILPLVYCLSKTTGSTQEVIQGMLHDSLPALLWQSKVAGRDLSVEDGYAALEMIWSGLKDGD